MKNPKKLNLPIQFVLLHSDVFAGMVFAPVGASELFRIVENALIAAGLEVQWIHVDAQDWGIEFTEGLRGRPAPLTERR